MPNPAEAACFGGPNPICIGGVVTDVLTTIGVIGGVAAIASIPGDTPTDTSNDSADTGKQCPPDGNDPCKGLRRQLQAHERKLREFQANPYGNDNRGFLANSPPERHQQIINGRIRNLQRQIENFRRLLEECERRHGMR